MDQTKNSGASQQFNCCTDFTEQKGWMDKMMNFFCGGTMTSGCCGGTEESSKLKTGCCDNFSKESKNPTGCC